MKFKFNYSTLIKIVHEIKGSYTLQIRKQMYKFYKNHTNDTTLLHWLHIKIQFHPRSCLRQNLFHIYFTIINPCRFLKDKLLNTSKDKLDFRGL